MFIVNKLEDIEKCINSYENHLASKGRDGY